MMHPRDAASVRGFTLLELLVVLTIAGLLLAAVPPMISAVIPGAEVKSATRELAVALRAARFAAVSRGVPIDIHFTADPPGYAVGDATVHALPGSTTLNVVTLSAPAVQWRDNAPTMDGEFRLRFRPDGSSSGARISLHRGKHHYTIGVGWLMGRITISPGDTRVP